MKVVKPTGQPTPRDASHSAAVEVSYRSSQWLLGLWIILPLVLALVIATTWNLHQPAWAWMLTSSVLALSLAVLGRLVIELRGQVLHWHYGFFGWPRWQLPLGEIEDLQAARGAAAHAGIQLGSRQSSFTAALGSPALLFTRKDGRRILLGSPEPEHLAQFIRARLPRPH